GSPCAHHNTAHFRWSLARCGPRSSNIELDTARCATSRASCGSRVIAPVQRHAFTARNVEVVTSSRHRSSGVQLGAARYTCSECATSVPTTTVVTGVASGKPIPCWCSFEPIPRTYWELLRFRCSRIVGTLRASSQKSAVVSTTYREGKRAVPNREGHLARGHRRSHERMRGECWPRFCRVNSRLVFR